MDKLGLVTNFMTAGWIPFHIRSLKLKVPPLLDLGTWGVARTATSVAAAMIATTGLIKEFIV